MKYCTLCKAKYDESVSFCPVDGEVLEDDPSSIVDTVLDGQYQMEAMLGKGGMGAVYRARHILLGDRVAIKVLPPEVRNNAEWLRRFRREGQAARRFRHPNAVTVYDLRTAADGTIYMVMEYVEGHTLDAEIRKRGRLTARESFELLSPIMSVLETAHSMGVVHRDLKPENIMVGKPGPDGVPVIKLLDLGIAKMREISGVDSGGNTALTMAGQVLGTPYYMSPEQWGEIPRDENEEIDGRADIYSLGLVFYEMIAGRRCFSGSTLHELRREHVSTTARPLHEIVPDVPRGFSDAIQRATAKDRADRQSSAGQLAAELKAELDTSSTGGVRNSAGNTAGSSSSAADTVAIGETVHTNSDLNAPTLIGLDSAGTVPPAGPPAVTRTIATSGAAAPDISPDWSAQAQTLVPSMESSVTIPEPLRVGTEPKRTRGKAVFVVGAGIVVILVLVVGVVGFLMYSKTRTDEKSSAKGNTNKSTATASGPKEITRYWLELEPRTANEEPTRVAGLVPIASGQSLRLHFVFNEGGYLYIIGPGGNNNQPTAFLTNKPIPESGLKTNEAKQGMDLSFPSGSGRLTLDRNAGTDTFTVIFSRSQLTSPQFLNAPVTGEPLKQGEQLELSQFVSKYRQSLPSTELDESNPQAPFVRVKVDPKQYENPIVFDMRIQHN
jgi:eukaryotic-like serine/threonine-protein kinase